MDKSKSKIELFLTSAIPMVRFTFFRLLQMIPVLFIISIVLFIIVESMPGDPVWAYVDPEKLNVDPQYLENLREELGLNGPAYERYFNWVMRLFEGDFGFSTAFRKPVAEIVPFYLKNSLLLNIVAFTIAFAFSIIIGVKSAVNKGSFFDKFFTVFSIAGISMPSFFLAMILIFFFAIIFPILPFSGMYDVRADYEPGSIYQYLDLAYHMILPVTVQVLVTSSSLIRYVRNSMLEVLKLDYIRTARSKGLKDKVIIYRHAFRNALIPVITLVGFYIPSLFSGSLLTETIFVWPGMGNLLNRSYEQRDRQIMLTITLFYAGLSLISNLIVDLSYGLADPRVRVGGGSSE